MSMNHNGIQRGVQKGITARRVGSAPSLGRVARMAGFGKGREHRHRKHIDKRSVRRNRARRTIVIGWSIAVGVMAVAALGVALAFWLYPLMQRKKDTTDQDLLIADARSRVVSKYKSPNEDDALALVKKALANRDPDEVETMIRPGGMTAVEVVDYLRGMKEVDGEITEYIWLSSIDKNGLSLEGVQVIFEKGDKSRNRLAVLTPDEKGVWKLDFPAFARWVKPSWESLMDGSVKSGIIRVFTGPGSYYNGPFRDDKKWIAYSVGSPDMDEILVGYCKVGSDQHRAMELMRTGDDNVIARATLEIRRVEGADRTQFEITRVLAEGWVMAEKAFDEIGR